MAVDSNAGEMSPLSYLKIFFRRKELLIISAIIGLVVGVCLGIILKAEYQSSAIILVEEGKTDNPLFDKLAISTTVQQRMVAIKESMLGWNSLVELVNRLGMDRNVRTPLEFEQLIDGIKGKTVFELRGQNLISLSFNGPDPEQAQAVVQNIADIFIERNQAIQNQETSSAIKFIEEQLKVYRGKIKSAQIAQLKEQLQTLLYDSTDEHPDVRKLKEQIKQKEDELRKENLEYQEDILKSSGSNEALIQGIQEALASLEDTSKSLGGKTLTGESDALSKVVLMEKLDKVKSGDGGINQGIYDMLLQRLETAKITERLQSSKEGTKYTTIDPPRVPLVPVFPNKVLFALGGMASGILFGIGLIFGFEFLDKSFLDVEDAKNFLGQPLLGAISKINTEATIRVERERQIWMYSLTIVGGIIIIILTASVKNFLG